MYLRTVSQCLSNWSFYYSMNFYYDNATYLNDMLVIILIVFPITHKDTLLIKVAQDWTQDFNFPQNFLFLLGNSGLVIDVTYTNEKSVIVETYDNNNVPNWSFLIRKSEFHLILKFKPTDHSQRPPFVNGFIERYECDHHYGEKLFCSHH